MRRAIAQAREAMPVEGLAEVCRGDCRGCSKKLLEYLDTELLAWEQRLEQGEPVGLGDLSQLVKTMRKIYRALAHQGVVPRGEAEGIDVADDLAGG